MLTDSVQYALAVVPLLADSVQYGVDVTRFGLSSSVRYGASITPLVVARVSYSMVVANTELREASASAGIAPAAEVTWPW